MKKVWLIVGIVLCIAGIVGVIAYSNYRQNMQNNEQSGENGIISGENDLFSGENDLFSGEEISGEDEISEPSEEMSNLMTTLIDAADAHMNAEYTAVIDPEMSLNTIGLTTEEFNENIEDSITYASQINISAQEVHLVKVKDSSKVSDIKQKIFDNANPRKWICVTAEKVVAVDSGNYILFVMGGVDLCDNLVTAFSDHFDGNVGNTLSLTVDENAPINPDTPSGDSNTPGGGVIIPKPL